MDLPSEQPSPPSMPPFGLSSLPSPTILTVIFGVLLVSVIGMGTAVVMTGEKSEVPVAVPTATPTPDPTATWREYTSALYGMTIELPKSWRIQEGAGVGDNSLYFHSDEVIRNTRYYVYVSTVPNPQHLSLQNALASYYGTTVPFTEEQLGPNTLFLSTAMPSRQGALSAFVPMVESSDYLTLSLTPFDNQRPLRDQERYESLFRTMLSTLRVTKAASSPVATSSADPDQSKAPQFWKTYVDRVYPFSFEYPPEYVLDTSRQGRVLLNDHLEVIVTPVDPANCEGVCPVRDKTSTVKVGEYSAKKYEGYITNEGGNVPQRYLQYVFREGRQYYMFTLYEVGLNSSLPQDRNPEPIPLKDVQVFEEILSSLRFRD